MKEKKLHIICFENPFPPDFGGVIDVFYKIKALHDIGFEIYLHCFYDKRNKVSDELKSITNQVYLYKKIRNPFYIFSSYPMSVRSRYDKMLFENIKKIDAPILFEGLQSTMLLSRIDFPNKKYLRLHNNESNFYNGMSKSETNVFKKILFYIEAKKYARYQKIMYHFDHVFALSNSELEFVKRYNQKATYIPVFSGNGKYINQTEYGQYAFYHGDLRLADNKKVALHLIRLFKNIEDYKLIIASSCGEELITKHLKNSKAVLFVKIEDSHHLTTLLRQAHINVLLSFQQSGTKLKIVNSLFKSRFCIVNSNMIDDQRILNLCEVTNSDDEIVNRINELKTATFTDNERRKSVLEFVFNDQENAKTIYNCID